MGFKNEPRGGDRYINFKKGKMICNGNEFTSFEGELVELEIKPDKYEEKPYQKLILYFWDAEAEKIHEMQMSMTSGYGFSFFATCPNIDPGVPMEISVGMNKLENGNSSGVLFIKQDGKNLKWHYSKKNNEKEWNKIPKPKELKAATKTKAAVLDYEARYHFIEKVLVAFNKKLSELYPKGHAGFKSKTKPVTDNVPASDIDENDDLPF